jgi:hypothetical protein
MAGYRGDYDPTGFDADNPATFPGYPGPYDEADWWYLTAAAVLESQLGGRIPAQTVEVGDRLYPVGFGRRYGDFNWGDRNYGGPIEAPWGPADVGWRAWSAAIGEPWDRPPPPYSGCPAGDRFPQWRLVVEMLYNAPDAARVYGEANWGDEIYGAEAVAGMQWNDVTSTAFSIVIRHGGIDGAPVVPVSQAQLDIRDEDADLFPMSIPAAWTAPRVGTMVRLSMLDPLAVWYPLFVGRLEQIADRHDTPPRLLELDAFGLSFDLVSTLARWWRHTETADVRSAAILDAVMWQWSDPVLPLPEVTVTVRASAAAPVDVVARDELDTTAISANHHLDFDLYGRPRFRPWPLAAAGDPLVVCDCAGHGGLVATRIDFIADTAETLNDVYVARGDADGTVGLAQRSDPASIDAVGRRSETLGFPITGLFALQRNLDRLADDALSRYGRIMNRAATFEVDTLADPGWFDVLVTLDSGRAVHVMRRGIAGHDLDLDAVVVGVERRRLPNRWYATVYLSTTTPTI